jgi:hypothetical protein
MADPAPDLQAAAADRITSSLVSRTVSRSTAMDLQQSRG